MALPRKTLVSLADTPGYRYVRRGYLCGYDQLTAKHYKQRRSWLEIKLLKTADMFTLKLCSCAVMSNHYHLVLHDLAKAWSELDVVTRWQQYFNGTLFSQCFLNSERLSETQWKALRNSIKPWRSKLCGISWRTRIVNETIAREANREGNCTGRFQRAGSCNILIRKLFGLIGKQSD
ncbi:MAG: hypothetical protein JKX81_11940 [Arenicella sp.]|nr:hypothetical protein [Arenicella sp.]